MGGGSRCDELATCALGSCALAGKDCLPLPHDVLRSTEGELLEGKMFLFGPAAMAINTRPATRGAFQQVALHQLHRDAPQECSAQEKATKRVTAPEAYCAR